MKLFLMILIPIAIFAKDSFINYGDGANAKAEAAATFPIPVYPYKAHNFINFVSDDVADDELDKVISNQATVGALALGKEKVFDAIEKLEKELQRLEDANKKLNIVTKRLDRMRNLIAQSHYASTNYLEKQKELKEDNLLLQQSRKEALLMLLEDQAIKKK